MPRLVRLLAKAIPFIAAAFLLISAGINFHLGRGTYAMINLSSAFTMIVIGFAIR